MINILDSTKRKLSEPVKPSLDWEAIWVCSAKNLSLPLLVALSVLPWWSEFSSTAKLFKGMESGPLLGLAIFMVFALVTADLVASLVSSKYLRRSMFVTGVIHCVGGVLLLSFAAAIPMFYHVHDALSVPYGVGGFAQFTFGALLLFRSKHGDANGGK